MTCHSKCRSSVTAYNTNTDLGGKIPNVCFVSPPFLQLKPEECSDRMPPVTMFVKERNTTQIVAVEILVENTHLIFLTFFFF